ncbi:hypothetical protein BGZ80_006891 [Entomortierella chlamydospora]|uniref:Uncharacterized protein n=1 Tax=Entomortierella chlamydospora TaxID=101097 RepID=A0A9P6T1Y4_9FUNG|nr:hypothetical protein BGZ80_006891 [Entomortierella chlamydospora]
MMGVARVYGQQYNFYYYVITFDYDLAVEHEILQPLKVIQDFELEMARGSRKKELAVEFGWATQSTIDLRDSLSDNSLSPSCKYSQIY